MIRKFIRDKLPDRHSGILQTPGLRWLGHLLHDSRLWSLNRRSVSKAVVAGLFIAWIPLPVQMPVAAVVAILIRANFPLAIAIVWVTNPITIAPMLITAWLVGSWLLYGGANLPEMEITFEWLLSQWSTILGPLAIGCLILAVTTSLSGYIVVQVFWRYYIYRAIEQRRQR